MGRSSRRCSYCGPLLSLQRGVTQRPALVLAGTARDAVLGPEAEVPVKAGSLSGAPAADGDGLPLPRCLVGRVLEVGAEEHVTVGGTARAGPLPGHGSEAHADTPSGPPKLDR